MRRSTFAISGLAVLAATAALTRLLWPETILNRAPRSGLSYIPSIVHSGSSVEHKASVALRQNRESRWARPLFHVQEGAEGLQGPTSAKAKGVSPPEFLGVLRDGSRAIALLRFEGHLSRIAKNASIGDWEVTEIARRAIVIKKGAKSLILELSASGAVERESK
jgi:hypothetical protein